MKVNTDLFWTLPIQTTYTVAVEDNHQPIMKSAPCPKCGRYTRSCIYEGDHFSVVHAQKKWPDILGPSLSTNIRIVSERVANDIAESNLSGYNLSPMKCTGILPKGKKITTSYFRLEAIGKATLLPIIPEDRMRYVCPVCGRWHPDEKIDEKNTVGVWPLSLAEWDGLDFVIANHDCYPDFFSSRRVIELCMKKGWTNFEFDARLINVHVGSGISNWEQCFEMQLRRYAEEERHNPRYPMNLEWDDHGIVLPEGWDKPSTSEPESEPEPRIPLSDHPFDNLAYFDGTCWQGTVDLSCAFGPCELVVDEDEKAEFDVEDNADYLPMPGQRKLFDFFVSSQEELLPVLKDTILRALKTVIGFPPVDQTIEFAKLSSLLERPTLGLGNASRNGIGTLDISFEVTGTYSHWDESKFGFVTEMRPNDIEEPNATITVLIACNPPKKSIWVKSWSIL